MDLEIIKKDGTRFLLSDHDAIVQDIRISSVPLIFNRGKIDGVPGSQSYGIEYDDRPIEVDFTFVARDLHDYVHLRDELYSVLSDTNGYYIRELRRVKKQQYVFIDLNEETKEQDNTDNKYVNGKQYFVELDGDFDFDQDNIYGSTTIQFKTSDLPFAESIYTTKELNDSGYSILANEFITNEDRKRFENLEIGGRNLLLNSSNISFNQRTGQTVTKLEEYQGIKNVVKITNSADATSINPIEQLSEPVVIGEEYTWSFLINYKGVKGRVPQIYTFDGGGYKTMEGEPIENKWVKMTFTFEATLSSRRFHLNLNGYENLYLANFKLKKGTVATDWTPAPEDFKTNDDYIMYFVEKGNFNLKNGGLFGLVDSIHGEHQKYKFTERNFSIWNAGNVRVEPETMYLKITATGTNGKLEIKNKTTNDVFKVNAAHGGALIVDGMNIKLNGVNVFRDTNKRYISLIPGMNEFEVIGQFTDITIDFRFYYK